MISYEFMHETHKKFAISAVATERSLQLYSRSLILISIESSCATSY